MKRGKKYRSAVKMYDVEKVLALDEALDVLEKFPKTKFDESVEVHVNLGIDPKKSDQHVRGTVVLPHGTGKSVKIVAFTSTQQKEAEKAGADLIGEQDLIDKLSSGETIDFDVAVATPEMMPKLAKIAKILGPKGLMPNPKTETVGPRIDKLIEGLKKGKLSFKNDKDGNLHQVVGKRSFDKKKLAENIEKLLGEIEKNRSSAVKGKFIKKASISATMSPGIRIQ